MLKQSPSRACLQALLCVSAEVHACMGRLNNPTLVRFSLLCPGTLLTLSVPASLIIACRTAQALLRAYDALELSAEPLHSIFFSHLCSLAALYGPLFMQVLMCIGKPWQSHPSLCLLEGMPMCLQGFV